MSSNLTIEDEITQHNVTGRRSLVMRAQFLLKHPRAREFSVNALTTFAVYAVGVAVEKLLVTPYLARQLDDATFGTLLLWRNAAAVLAGGLYSGIYNLLLRQNSELKEQDKPAAVFSATVVSVVLSLLVAALMLLVISTQAGVGFIRQNWLPLCAFGVWGTATTATYVLQTYWRMQFRLRVFNALQLFIGIMLLMVIPLHAWGGLAGVYWGWAAAGLIPLLLCLTFGWRAIAGKGTRLWDGAAAWQTLQEMWIFVWGTTSATLLQNTDRFIIGWLLGAAAVSPYFKATSAAYMIVVPVEPLAGLILSMAAQERMGPATIRNLRRLNVLIVALIVGLILCGALFGRVVTDLLYGAGTFAAGRSLYFIILFGCAFSLVSNLLRGMLILHAPMRWILWHDTASVILLASLSVPLVLFFGLLGAALAVALTLLLRAVLSEAVIWLAVRRHLTQVRPEGSSQNHEQANL